MSNEPKHTATPWGHSEEKTPRGHILWSNDKTASHRYIGYIHAKEDAARIVQCVNEYDGLIETIESLRAENAELIEALRVASTRFGYLALYDNSERNGVIPSVGMNEIDTTLAKYEKP